MSQFQWILLCCATFALLQHLPVTIAEPSEGSDDIPSDDGGDEVTIDLNELAVEFFPDGTEKLESTELMLAIERLKKEKTDVTRTQGHRENDRRKRWIFAADERLPVTHPNQYRFPYCAVGLLDSGCTATFIGPYHAITAASCVYNITTDQWRQNELNIYRRRNCNSPGVRHTWTNVYTTIGYTRFHLPTYDYALIVYGQSSSCWMSFGFIEPWTGVGFDICGYPEDNDVFGCIYDSMWCSCCHYSLTYSRGNNSLLYRCDTNGNVGSALHGEVRDDPSGVRAVYGVHTNEATISGVSWNFGPRITRDRFIQIAGWMNATGYDPLAN